MVYPYYNMGFQVEATPQNSLLVLYSKPFPCPDDLDTLGLMG